MTAIAFDLDGTLIDCRRRQVALAAELVRAHSTSSIDEEVFWLQKRSGASTREALELIGVDRPTAALIADLWVKRIEDENLLAVDDALPFARRALEVAAGAGFSVLVLTARSVAERVGPQLQRLGLSSSIDQVVVVSPRAGIKEKARVLESTGPLLYVGDSEVDLEAAALASVPFGAVSCGQRTAAFLAARGADDVARTAHEALVRFLARRRHAYL